MLPVYIVLGIIIVLLIVILVFAYKAATSKENSAVADLKYKFETLNTQIGRIEAAVKQEIATNRKEGNEAARIARTELAASLLAFGEQVNKSVEDFNRIQKENFYALLNKQSEQNTTTSGKLEQMREIIEKKISDLQSGNEKKLDEMRATVDEKLQKTLETRLGESFKLVSERLEAVHKGLGDMQQLATGVGDLKRVLSNVKTRGVLGEYQLENILEQILTLEQYAKNVKTKEGSNALVEFALKLPGKVEQGKTVWLPIDSKFPKEDFELLTDAYDHANLELIEEYRKNFVKGIKKCAADISSKYIDPPNTTDFAILFLPFESLYAEVLRTPGLFESVQREYKIIITGPTTLSALLNSLQMGFRTLAIERRSSEVWQLLSAVKTEFGNFGSILEKTQKKIQEASNVIEQAGIRSRAIEKKLRNVQELPKEQASKLLDNPAALTITPDEPEE
jgi:DNA recombination protein RmuC